MNLEEYSVYLHQLATAKKEAVITVAKKVKTKTVRLISKTFKPNTKK